MKALLVPFIKMLEEEGLVRFDILDETEEHFKNRFKIQKYLFLARYFGLEVNYSYNIYRYGPYSPELAEDYYSLARNKELYDKVDKQLPASFEKSKFLELVKDKDTKWLEIAATLLDLKGSFDGEELIEHVYDIKSAFEKDFIKSVYNDLRSTHIL